MKHEPIRLGVTTCDAIIANGELHKITKVTPLFVEIKYLRGDREPISLTHAELAELINGGQFSIQYGYFRSRQVARRAIAGRSLMTCVSANTLGRQFDVGEPDTAWVSDITSIKTNEGFVYLAVVIDLYSRRVIGWATQSRQPTDLVLQALLMPVWRRKPKQSVLIHTDQGSQYTSRDWAAFLRAHNLEHSMSRRGNCHGFKDGLRSRSDYPGDHLKSQNAVAESFFNLLKRERIRRRTYKTREQARQDIFDYIEMF